MKNDKRWRLFVRIITDARIWANIIMIILLIFLLIWMIQNAESIVRFLLPWK